MTYFDEKDLIRKCTIELDGSNIGMERMMSPSFSDDGRMAWEIFAFSISLVYAMELQYKKHQNYQPPCPFCVLKCRLCDKTIKRNLSLFFFLLIKNGIRLCESNFAACKLRHQKAFYWKFYIWLKLLFFILNTNIIKHRYNLFVKLSYFYLWSEIFSFDFRSAMDDFALAL